MTKSNIIQECSTHEARKMEDGTINIYLKPMHLPADEDTKELFFPEELCYRNVEKDDVFAIFESIEENNRIMFNEFVSEMR